MCFRACVTMKERKYGSVYMSSHTVQTLHDLISIVDLLFVVDYCSSGNSVATFHQLHYSWLCMALGI
jgi:virulence-associated protein VapD